MVARSHSRGHKIEYRNGWIYSDTKESICKIRPCVRCKKNPTPEGYDACLGFIPGAISACCGHGVSDKIIEYGKI